MPIQTILRDSARAIQYLRAHAAEFGIDKSRVAAFGGGGDGLVARLPRRLGGPESGSGAAGSDAAGGGSVGCGAGDLWSAAVAGGAGAQKVLEFASDAEVAGVYGAKSRAELD